MVLQLRSSSDLHRQRAFEELCHVYWKPLYTFAHRGGWSSHDAEDLTQGFLTQGFLTHLLRTEDLGPLSPEMGRLRAFLRAAFSNFIADQARRGTRQKRGGTKTDWLDIESAELQSHVFLQLANSPDEAFDRHWARIVLKRTLGSLRSNFLARGRGETFKELEIFLGSDESAPPYREVAERLGQSENTIAAAVIRMRREFRDLLRQEIADTLGPGEDIDEELKYLLRVAD